VGYFSPAPPLAVGASVLAGDQLGSIDVLGIDQEVYAPADGIVARVLVEDGQAVEYGQALADIDPLGIDIAAEAGLEGDDG
jgi:acetyl-CoA carboxylase biotin carboxyl carrier protein